MITILKETPVTAFGRDCIEMLVKDSECWGTDCCDKCCYRGWYPTEDCDADCATVHGCGTSPFRYFQVRQI